MIAKLRTINKLWILILTLTFITFISSIGTFYGHHAESITNTPITNISIHSATVPRSIDERISQAAVIALVTVDSIEPARWNTPDGKTPANIQTYGQETGESPIIYRPVHLRVEKYFKHPQEQTIITINQLGGQIDGITFESSEEMVEFKEGQQAVVFLSRKRPPASSSWGVYSAYILDGAVASSKVDKISLPVNQLFEKIAKTSN